MSNSAAMAWKARSMTRNMNMFSCSPMFHVNVVHNHHHRHHGRRLSKLSCFRPDARISVGRTICSYTTRTTWSQNVTGMAMIYRHHNHRHIQRRNYIFLEDSHIHKMMKNILRSVQTKLGIRTSNGSGSVNVNGMGNHNVKKPQKKQQRQNHNQNEPILVALRSTKDKVMNTDMNIHMKKLRSITKNVHRKHTKLRSFYAHRKSILQQKSHKLLSKWNWKRYNKHINNIMNIDNASVTRHRYRTSLKNLLARARTRLSLHHHNHNHSHHPKNPHTYVATIRHKLRRSRKQLPRRMHRLLELSILKQMRERTPRARSFIKRLKSITQSRWNTILEQGTLNLRHGYKRAMNMNMNTNMDNIDEQRIQHHAITIQEPFRKEWFSNIGGYPLTSKDPTTGRYCNPWKSQSTNGLKRLTEVWRWKKTRFTESFLDPPPQLNPKDGNVNDVHGYEHGNAAFEFRNKELFQKEHTKRIKALSSPPPKDEIQMTWIGHATNLIHIGREFTILTDPVFSHKASPFQMLSDFEFMGVPRFLPPSLSIQDLSDALGGEPGGGRGRGCKKIDLCIISHDHYDHLDWNSVQLIQKERLVKFWAVPMGMKEWFLKNIHGIGEDQIVEMEWWDSITFVKESGGGGRDSEEEKGCPFPSSSSRSLKIRGKITNIVKTDQIKDHPRHNDRSNDNNDISAMNPESGDTSRPSTKDIWNQPDASELTITCAPAQHWCSRTPFDRNTRLWCSWAMHSKLMLQDGEGGNVEHVLPREYEHNQTSSNISTTAKYLSFYFAGDTGYPKEFPLHRQIGDVLGPFDLASIPIGAYKPRFFMQDSHCDPYEAVQIHQDIRSKRSVAIHWGTFPLANESFEEPPTLLLQAAKRAQEDFRVILHGDSIQSNSSSTSSSTSSSSP